jgi:hypothetical protein
VNSVIFFTMATLPERGFTQYLASCIRHGIIPRVLGMGQKWEGWSHKIRLVREQLDRLNNDDLVVVTDSYDLVFQAGVDDLVRNFALYNKPIVFSSERGEGYPNPIVHETPSPLYRALNGGFWMAYADAAKEMIDEAWNSDLDDGAKDDQGTLQVWFSNNPDKAEIDYLNIIISSTHVWNIKDEIEYYDGMTYNKLTQTFPCVFHGLGSLDMSPAYDELGLPDQNELIPSESTCCRYRTYALAAKNPWPAVRPDVALDGEAFFTDGNRRLLGRLLRRPMNVILELGSWVGAGSTRFFLENSDALLICNDTWRGDSPEMIQGNEHKIPILYETFCRNNWDDRDRIVLLRMDVMDGLREVAASGVIPDLIYVDANHDYDAVMAQLSLICKLFPSSIVTGDDFEAWPQVWKAVIDFTEKHNIQFINDDNCWMLLK